MENTSLYRWLASAGLEGFYNDFRKSGVDESNFASLQFQDYDKVGVAEHQDRQKLFKLIQVVKRELEGGGGGGGGGGGQEDVRVSRSERERDRGSYARPQQSEDNSNHSNNYNNNDNEEVAEENIPKIQVAVRKRPMNRGEVSRNEPDIARVENAKQKIIIHEPKQKVDLTKYVESHHFIFDEVIFATATAAAVAATTTTTTVAVAISMYKVVG